MTKVADGGSVMETDDLVKRARELAALAEGDYEAYSPGWFYDNTEELSYKECELVAHAPEMAMLLERMADIIEAQQ